MSFKIFGAILVIFGCGGCGFSMAAAQKREEHSLRQLLRGLEYMDCELQFRQTPLPQLCRGTAGILTGTVRCVLEKLAQELDRQVAPDAGCCMNAAIAACPNLPPRVRIALTELGSTLGLFDLPGQLRGMEAVKSMCHEGIQELSQNRTSRLRSYQTLGLCAGAALAILFL